ncbi:aldehyde ferredoxin oxidoreductase N-terminal domain-containing protein [Bacillus sp. N9]
MAVYGYHQKIVHIDLTTRTTKIETMDENWYRVYAGGGLLGTYFMLRDTPAKIDAYDPENLLIFASSIIAGNDGPGLARFSVITKSPLSQGIGETRCEGPWAQALKGSGYDAITIRGKSDTPVYIMIEEGKIDVKEASFYGEKIRMKRQHYWKNCMGKMRLKSRRLERRGKFSSVCKHCNIAIESSDASRCWCGHGIKNVKAVVLKGKTYRPFLMSNGWSK